MQNVSGEWLTKSEGKANESENAIKNRQKVNSMLFGNAINQNLQETHCNKQMWECMKQGNHVMVLDASNGDLSLTCWFSIASSSS
jgi:hypothetical protein